MKMIEEKIVKVKEKAKQYHQQNGHDQDDPESRCLRFNRDNLHIQDVRGEPPRGPLGYF